MERVFRNGGKIVTSRDQQIVRRGHDEWDDYVGK